MIRAACMGVPTGAGAQARLSSRRSPGPPTGSPLGRSCGYSEPNDPALQAARSSTREKMARAEHNASRSASSRVSSASALAPSTPPKVFPASTRLAAVSHTCRPAGAASCRRAGTAYLPRSVIVAQFVDQVPDRGDQPVVVGRVERDRWLAYHRGASLRRVAVRTPGPRATPPRAGHPLASALLYQRPTGTAGSRPPDSPARQSNRSDYAPRVGQGEPRRPLGA